MNLISKMFQTFEHLNIKRLIIIGPAYPLRGGPAVFNENLAWHCQQSGIETEILSYTYQYPSFLFPGSTQFNTSDAPKDQIKRRVLIHTLNPYTWWTTAKYIKQQKPDVILIRFWLPFFAPALGSIARLVFKSTRVIALTDNVIPHETRIGDRMLIRYFIKSCHGFITMSKSVKDELEHLNIKKPIALTPHPLYETYGPAMERKKAREILQLPMDADIVLYFGLIRHYKGLDLLIEAFNNCAAQLPNMYLLIAGECYEKPEPYSAMIAESAYKQRIIWHQHFIKDEAIPAYFCAANLAAQTYRHATNSGVSMLAYYYRTPLLVTATGGLQDIVPHNKAGFCIPVNTSAIAEHLVLYFKNNLEQPFKRGLESERIKYQWSAFLDALQTLYKSIS